MRSLPNKAVDVMADKLSGDRLIFASSTHGSLNPAPAGHVRFPLRSRRLYDPHARLHFKSTRLSLYPFGSSCHRAPRKINYGARAFPSKLHND